MTNDVPVGRGDKLLAGDSPIDGYSDALVDDSVELVDSASLLAGSQTTPIGYTPTGAITNKNRTKTNATQKSSTVVKSTERTTAKPTIKTPGVMSDPRPGIRVEG